MYKNILAALEEENPEALFAEGFNEALIGIAYRFGTNPLAVYDRNKCIEILAEDMSYEEAEEFFEFNVIGSWMGKNTPIFVVLGENLPDYGPKD